MNITLSHENPADYRVVEQLTREAFWGCMSPTCDEHYLVHLLRGCTCFVPELDYVARVDGEIVGSILYSRAHIIANDGRRFEVLTFGPLSVAPTFWNKGVGTALVRHSIREAKQLGYRAIVIYGHPDYYPRFGFRTADTYRITTPEGTSMDALMALPLHDGALDGVSGTFQEDDVFHVDAQEAQEFDRTFPYREPALMISIDVLLEHLKPAVGSAFTDRGIQTLASLTRFSGREISRWDGMDDETMATVNRILSDHGYAKKPLPKQHRDNEGHRVSQFHLYQGIGCE